MAVSLNTQFTEIEELIPLNNNDHTVCILIVDQLDPNNVKSQNI